MPAPPARDAATAPLLHRAMSALYGVLDGSPRPPARPLRRWLVAGAAAANAALLLLLLWRSGPPAWARGAGGADAAGPAWAVRFDARARVPFTLWQSARSREPPPQAVEPMGSWRGACKLPAEAVAPLADNTDRRRFILERFGSDVLRTFDAFPHDVMRADFWRYAVLYVHGGLYADIDVRCNVPPARWLPPTDGADVLGADWATPPRGGVAYGDLRWRDCAALVGVEGSGANMIQWAIAAVPGHPVLRRVMEMALERARSRRFYGDPEAMVHRTTSPGVWKEAVAAELGLPEDTSGADVFRAAWTDPAVYARARRMRLCLVGAAVMGEGEGINVQHLEAALRWRGTNYTSWKAEVGFGVFAKKKKARGGDEEGGGKGKRKAAKSREEEGAEDEEED